MVLILFSVLLLNFRFFFLFTSVSKFTNSLPIRRFTALWSWHRWFCFLTSRVSLGTSSSIVMSWMPFTPFFWSDFQICWIISWMTISSVLASVFRFIWWYCNLDRFLFVWNAPVFIFHCGQILQVHASVRFLGGRRVSKRPGSDWDGRYSWGYGGRFHLFLR